MACLFDSKITLTQAVLDGLHAAKIGILIQVDCSHARNFQTWPQNAPAKVIKAKPIELDTALTFVDGGTPASARAALRSTKFNGPLYKLSEEIDAVDASGHRGFDFILHQNLKVGFAQFDPKLVDLKHEALAPIVELCNAPNAATFNAKPANLRKVMGMYKRSRVGASAAYAAPAPDAQPRVAA